VLDAAGVKRGDLMREDAEAKPQKPDFDPDADLGVEP
jgi:hypothetical protein